MTCLYSKTSKSLDVDLRERERAMSLPEKQLHKMGVGVCDNQVLIFIFQKQVRKAKYKARRDH